MCLSLLVTFGFCLNRFRWVKESKCNDSYYEIFQQKSAEIRKLMMTFIICPVLSNPIWLIVIDFDVVKLCLLEIMTDYIDCYRLIQLLDAITLNCDAIWILYPCAFCK